MPSSQAAERRPARIIEVSRHLLSSDPELAQVNLSGGLNYWFLHNIDDPTLTKVAAIALLNCSLTPTITGYMAHIHNHLSAMVQSPGVLQEQVTLANTISPELDSINSWLQQIHQDARQLIAMDNPHLLTAGKLRSDMDSLATKTLNGGTDPITSQAEKGVSTIATQIQQLATMDITRY